MFCSPRSIEACKMKGIEQSELLAKTINDLENEPIPIKFLEFKDEFLELKASFYEKNRLFRLQMCLEVK